MAALTTSSLYLPQEYAGRIIAKAGETSAIAKLSPSQGQTFTTKEHIILSADPEAEWVAEGAQKSSSEVTTTRILSAIHKAQVSVRMTDEVVYADEDTRLGLMETVYDKLGEATGRALDYGIFHGVSPLTGATVQGMTALSSTANQQTLSGTPQQEVDELPDAIIAAGYVPNGVALSVGFANTLRKARNATTGAREFPEIQLDPTKVGSLGGLTAAVSGTVNGTRVAGANSTWGTKCVAFAGDYSLIKWGIVRDMGVEVIRYGDPDGAGDLRRTNEVLLRAEILYAWAVLDPLGFTCLKTA